MKLFIEGYQRKDGKQKVTLIYQGGPNAFGGSYPPRVYTKLATPAQLEQWKQEAEEVSKR